MPRLKRAESQALTRERLLESAKRVFLRDGYVRASVDKVAEEAGYSKGAVYSNFEGKEALFLELLRRKFATDLQAGRQLFERHRDAEELLHALHAHYEHNTEVLDFTLVSAEFLTQVGRGSAFAREYSELYAAQRQAVAALIGEIFARAGLVPPAPLEELGAAAVGMTLGLAVQRGADRQAITPALWSRAFALYLRGLLAMGSAASQDGRADGG